MNKVHSNKNDNVNLIKTSILTLNSIAYLLFICKEPSDFEYYIHISRDIVEKAWTFLREIDNIEFRTKLLYYENIVISFSNETELTYGNKKEEKIRKKFFLKCKETLDLIKNCEDFFILGQVYWHIGTSYCFYGTLYAKDRNERFDLAEKGFDLIEKALIFCRASRNNIDLIYGIYFLDYCIGVFGRFEYYQKRILKDVHELQNLSKIYDDFYTFHGILTSRISIMYYNNFAGRSFLKDDIRKAYAEAGIKHARKQLENLQFGPYIIINYQLLTQFYSYLVNIATGDDPLEDYIQQMFHYANLAENLARLYQGGNARSAGFTSI